MKPYSKNWWPTNDIEIWVSTVHRLDIGLETRKFFASIIGKFLIRDWRFGLYAGPRQFRVGKTGYNEFDVLVHIGPIKAKFVVWLKFDVGSGDA